MEKQLISFETARLFVRSLTETDKDYYMSLRIETSEIAPAYTAYPGLSDYIWNKELNDPDSIYLVGFLKETGIFIAQGSIQDYKKDSVNIGIGVVKEYRDKGYGTEMLEEILQFIQTNLPCKKPVYRTDAANIASRRVAEKSGLVLSEYEPALAAKAMSSLIRSGGNLNDDIKKNYTEILEQNKDSVCVYILANEN